MQTFLDLIFLVCLVFCLNSFDRFYLLNLYYYNNLSIYVKFLLLFFYSSSHSSFCLFILAFTAKTTINTTNIHKNIHNIIRSVFSQDFAHCSISRFCSSTILVSSDTHFSLGML